MKLHANARTCPNSRGCWSSGSRGLVADGGGRGRRRQRRTARTWLARWRAEGEAGLARSLLGAAADPAPDAAERVRGDRALRRLRMTAAEIAEVARRWRSRRSRRAQAGRPRQALAARAARAAEPLRAPPPGRARPRRRQEARPRSSRPATASPATARASEVPRRRRAGSASRLGVRPRLRRRPHPARLRRGARPTRKRTTAIGFLRRAVALFAEPRHRGRAGDDRQRLAPTSRTLTPPPAASSACATCAPGPTGRAPTARPSASSRRCCASGPTGAIYGQLPSAPCAGALARALQHHAHTAPSATSPPPAEQPR